MTDLLQALLAEHQPTSTLERHLTEQLAHILAKQATAEDNEAYLLGKQPQYLLTHRPDGRLVPDPAYLLYNNRLDAMRLHQARLGREQSRILRELHRLKRTPLAVKAADEPAKPLGTPANDPGSAAFSASEPKPAPIRPANEPKSSPFLASEPNRPVSPPAKELRQQPGLRANEPKEPHAWPVLDDATADRIKAMIASGDVAQLAEAARLLGLMDRNAPPPPSGFLAPAQSRLAG